MGTIKTSIQVFGNMRERFNSIYESVRRTTNVIESMPRSIDIQTIRSAAEINSINSLIDDTVAKFRDIKEGVSLIEYNEIEKLEIMKRELDNIVKSSIIVGDAASTAKSRWEENVLAVGENVKSTRKLQIEYLKLDKQFNTLDKSYFRTLEQIAKQVDKVSELKIPTIETTKELMKQDSAYSKVHSRIMSSIQGQQQFNRHLDMGIYKASNLGDKISGYVKSFIGIMAIKKGVQGTIGAAMDLSMQFQVMQGMFGNSDVAASYFNRLQGFAEKSGTSMLELSELTQQLLSTTRNPDNLMALNEIAEKLVVKNPSKNLSDAGYAINEALSGNLTSLKNRFNLSAGQVKPIKEAIERGHVKGVIEAFNTSLNMAGITDEVMEAYRNSASKQMDRIKNIFINGFAKSGMEALKMIEPSLARIKEFFESDNGAKFFNGIAIGINAVTLSLVGILNYVTSNWETVKTALMYTGALVAALTVKFLVLKTAAAAAATIAAIKWAIAVWPLTLIIASLGIIIYILLKSGVTAETIVGSIAGSFMWLWGVIYNIGVGMWNGLIWLSQATESLFYNMTVSVLNFFQKMFNAVAIGINWLADMSNNILGTKFVKIETNLLQDKINDVKAKAQISTEFYNSMKGSYKDLGEEFNKGFNAGSEFTNKVKDVFQGFGGMGDLLDVNNMQADSLGSIDRGVGGIKNSIDLNSEDIKYLRDLAEREAINEFTTNLIVPQSTLNVEKVNNELDLERALDVLTERIIEAHLESAEGVY